jgi:hypothetical protein
MIETIYEIGPLIELFGLVWVSWWARKELAE